MPTRTAFIVTIGDVLETGPPRTGNRSAAAIANKNNNTNLNSGQSGLDDSDDSSTHSRPQSPASSTYSDAPRPRRFRKRNRMKTRVSNTGGTTSANAVSQSTVPVTSQNGITASTPATAAASTATGSTSVATNNGRRSRLQSVDQVYIGNSNNNPLSPRTRSSVKQEIDEEVSFVDPLINDNAGCNGENGHADDTEDPIAINDDSTTQATSSSNNATKKKPRKSSAEKFLEDNTEYYGFQDHDNDTKHVIRSRTASNTNVDPLDISGSGCQKSDRSRHSSGGSTAKRRIRINSSSSNYHGEFIATKKLRVEVTKLDETKLEELTSDALSSADETESRFKKSRSLRSNTTTASVSPSSKKRRSELDKLLEAGLSSFHCETAKQAADRLGLGPLKVDVSDNNSESGSNSTVEAATDGKSRLLQEAASGSDVNQNTPNSKSRKPKKLGKKKSPKLLSDSKNKVEIKSEEEDEDDEDTEDEDENQDLVEALKRVDGSEVEVSSIDYSFEKTPFRESWFRTYSRQDQGDEILYYPDHQSFPLPYEMPMNTFYGRKPGAVGKNFSGTATPIEEESNEPPEEPQPIVTPTRSTRAGNKNNSTKKSNLNQNSAQSASATSHMSTRDSNSAASSSNSATLNASLTFFDKIGPRRAAALKAAADPCSRKSPRGHASTKSLMTNSPYVDALDEEAFEDLLQFNRIGGIKNLAYLDECSNDSIESRRECETEAKLAEIADRLDTFFCEEDTVLLPSITPSTSDHKKRSRRLSSSGKKRRSKDSVTSDSGNGGLLDKGQNGGGHGGGLVDRLVDSNVDPMFLDCLEDELPSVTFDDLPPEPMELVSSFEKCTSINLYGRKKKKSFSLSSPQMPPITSTIAETNLIDNKNSENNLVSSDSAQSTILRRLLTTPETKAAEKAAKKAKLTKIEPSVEQEAVKTSSSSMVKKAKSPTPPPQYDSSSECNSAVETASIASSTASNKRKRKRNMTGFPSPKKNKKPVVLGIKKQPSPSIANKKSPPNTSVNSNRKLKELPPSKNTKNNSTQNSKSKTTTTGKSTVQLKLGMGKNGLSLQKPAGKTKVVNSTAPTTNKRGRPITKGKNSVKPSSTNKATGQKTKTKTKIIIPLIDITEVPSESDDDDIDDEDDKNFRPNMGVARKKAGSAASGTSRGRKPKKKKRSLNVKPRKILVPVVTIDDDSDEDEDTEDASDNNVDVEGGSDQDSVNNVQGDSDAESEEVAEDDIDDVANSDDDNQSADDEEEEVTEESDSDSEDKPIRKPQIIAKNMKKTKKKTRTLRKRRT